jgi:hypothetical protein
LVTLNNIPVKITAIAGDVRLNPLCNLPCSFHGDGGCQQGLFFLDEQPDNKCCLQFCQLKENSNAEKAGEQISALEHKYREETEFAYRIFLQPLDDIHLHSSGIQYAEQFHTNSSKIVYTLISLLRSFY